MAHPRIAEGQAVAGHPARRQTYLSLENTGWVDAAGLGQCARYNGFCSSMDMADLSTGSYQSGHRPLLHLDFLEYFQAWRKYFFSPYQLHHEGARHQVAFCLAHSSLRTLSTAK